MSHFFPLDICKGLLLGLATGDALGVPVKGKTKDELKEHPAISFFDNRSQTIPNGTWTAGSALSFCLAEALLENAGMDTIAENFLLWQKDNYWTAMGKKLYADKEVETAISRIDRGVDPKVAGNTNAAGSSGAGALMRISPLVFFLTDKPVHKRYEIVKQVTSITHSDTVTVTACFYYLEFLLELMEGREKFKIYMDLQERLKLFLKSIFVKQDDIRAFDSLLSGKIYEKDEREIKGTHYILDALEAGMWCFLNSQNYKEATLKAVNLGNETNTSGAITGALAGVCYGAKNIPTSWVNSLVKKDEIGELAARIYFKMRE